MATRERQRNTDARSKQRSRRAGSPGQDFVYTQPTPFNRGRFILKLATVIAVVLALVLGMSIFFKVDQDKILVSGTKKYTAYDIVKASGVNDGENLLTLRKSEIGGRIMKALPYVTQVRVGIELPDTVNIEIVESDVAYSLEATDGSWWLIRADGKVLDKTNPADAARTTTVKGLRLANPVIGEQAVAEEPVQEETEETETTEPVTVLGSERLQTLITILTQLEANGIIGEIASVDVTNINNLELWFGERYQVVLGSREKLEMKVRSMKAAIDQMEEYSSGMLDVSFTLKETEVVYTPFE